MISAIINKFKKTVVIVSLISVGIILVAGFIILLSTGTSKTEEAFDYRATAQEYGVSENVAYLIRLTQQYNENADVEMLANMSITEIVDNLRNEYVNVFKYKKIAQEYGVSQDIAYIADKIVMLDSNADIELLVNLPITELVDTLREKLLQPQTPDAEDADSTEVAYVDESEDVEPDDTVDEPIEDVDTEDANDEPVEDVDTENDDADTQDSGSNSGDTSSEEPKPTRKPDEEPQTEWSEWSEWYTSETEMINVMNSQYADKQWETETKVQQREVVGEIVWKYRERSVTNEYSGEIANTEMLTRDQIKSQYSNLFTGGTLTQYYKGDVYIHVGFGPDDFEGTSIPLYYTTDTVTILTDWGEWSSEQIQESRSTQVDYTIDINATQWSEWEDGSPPAGKQWAAYMRTLYRFRWR